MMKVQMTVRSAKIFEKRRRLFGKKMHLYAVVSGPSSSSPSQSTEADIHGGAAPFWWSPMEFDLRADQTLVARIKRRAVVGADKTVGIVELPAAALLDYYRRNSPGNVPADIALALSSKSGKGKPRGILYVSYVFPADPLPSAPPLQLDHATPPVMLHSLF